MKRVGALEAQTMSGHFGTESQKRLKAIAGEAADWIRATPGPCQSGRFIDSDDSERLGWDVIEPS